MNIYYLAGLAIPLVYIFLYVLGGALRPGYNHISHSVSELLSPGAPNRPLLMTVQIFYALLHLVFGWGVLKYVNGAAPDQILGPVGAWMIIALGITTLGTVIFPQDAEGSPETRAGRLHKILVFGGLIPFSILSTLLVGLWTGKAGLFAGFDIYSFITVGAVVVMGGLGGAMVKSRFAGLVERIAALVTQQWLFVLGFILLIPSTNLASGDEMPRPNIILCMTDDQGWGDAGYMGHPVLRTPHLDEMAKEGIRFERFYSGAPVCSPTRGSCLTGRHPYRYGIPFANSGHMKKEEITLAEVLRSMGYSTGFFGKWHLGTLTTKMKDSNRGIPGDSSHYSPPWENGFDVSFATEAKVPTYWKDSAYLKYGTHYWTGPEQLVPADQITGDDSKLIMDRALDFIRGAAKENAPFFTIVWFHAPHLPVVSAPPYTDGYTEHKDYYGCISAMDEQIGRLRATLKSSGVEENTILWFCSDNGPEGDSSSPGRTHGLRGRKRSLYEGGVRVPGLVVWPKMIKEGRLVKMPCSTSDYFPTLMDVLGHPLDSDKVLPYDGISLLPLIKGETEQRSHPIAFESRNQLSLTDNRYKIYSSDQGESYELYDLILDENESENIAHQHPEIVESMVRTLEQWRFSCRESLQGKDYAY